MSDLKITGDPLFELKFIDPRRAQFAAAALAIFSADDSSKYIAERAITIADALIVALDVKKDEKLTFVMDQDSGERLAEMRKVVAAGECLTSDACRFLLSMLDNLLSNYHYRSTVHES